MSMLGTSAWGGLRRVLTGAPTPGASQSRRSFSSHGADGAMSPLALSRSRTQLAFARARIRDAIQKESGVADSKVTALPSLTSLSDPKGPLNQPPRMTRTFEGEPCHRDLLRGIHGEHAHVEIAFMNGLPPAGDYMPDGRFGMRKAAEALVAKRVPKEYQRVRGPNPHAILKSWPAGQAFTTNKAIALKFADTHPETAERQYRQGVVFVLDSAGMHATIMDHRQLPKEGAIASEDQFTVFGHVPAERIIGAYVPVGKDDTSPSVLQDMGLKWKPNPRYQPPALDGKAP